MATMRTTAEIDNIFTSSAFNALAPLARKKKKVMSLVLDGEKSPNLARVS